MLKHILLAPITLFSLLTHLYTSNPVAPSFSNVIDQVSLSVVKVTMHVVTPYGEGDGVCTGEVVAQDQVLTAAHCMGTNMTAGDMSADVVAYDVDYDLALLRAKTFDKPALVRSSKPVKRLDLLLAFGYALGLPSLTVRPVQVLFPNLQAPWDPGTFPGILVQPQYTPGMSGGPVTDYDGKMVGIVQQRDSDESMGWGASMEPINRFLSAQASTK